MKSTTLQGEGGTWLPADADVSGSQLILVFGSGERLADPALRAALRSRAPTAEIVGCSTAGEIADGSVTEDGAVAVALEFATTRVRTAAREIKTAETSHHLGVELAEALIEDDLRHVLVLSDGLHVNGTGLADGLRAGLPNHVSATGGLAGDGSRFARTVVLHNDDVGPDRVVVVGLYGQDLEVGWGSAGGWEAFGPRRRVTKATANVLFELDGTPALALYKTYLGDRAEGLPATGLLFPLELLPGDKGDPSLVRTILAVDEAQQSLTFAGDVPVGRQVRLMKSTIDKLIWGAEQAADAVEAALKPEFALLVSCVGRRLVLGQRVEEEVEAVINQLGHPAGVAGFYSYGEIGPGGLAHGCELHNQTMTLTTLAERAR